ncbi:MAG TPA: ABC transporter substrate-binding protein [Stellaceae bacterium]|nr:ABC transporter substrate-binding protein [Stellaceae bacterium]
MAKLLTALVAALVALAAPACAGKADDTLSIAVTDWFSTLDPYQFPLDEAAVFYGAVYETLVVYDARKQVFVPRLATSWQRIDDRTIEFVLRADVKFHNGDTLDADDVVETIKYIVDPAFPMRHKDLYDWVETVEKRGPLTVRITAKHAMPVDLQTIAFQFQILDAKVLTKLDNKADYGRVSRVGTGPYKVVSFDQRKMVLERFDDYWGGPAGPDGPRIKRIVALPIPDRQTQIAQFLTGALDVIRNASADTARELGKMPDTRVTGMHNGQLMYITLDALGRSDNKAMTDQRVRQAFMMAIDRKELARSVIPGGDIATILDGICVEGVVGCAASTHPPDYDPEGAKKLLAASGYPDGFDLELDVHEPIKEIAEAIAGQLRKVGIRASTRPLPSSLYVRLRGEGKFTAFVGYRPTAARPDMDDLCDFFFNGNRDYWNDPVLKEVQRAGALEFDEEKRVDIYRRGIDQVNRMNYILPLTDLPIVFVHGKDVRIVEDPLNPIANDIRDFYWSK